MRKRTGSIRQRGDSSFQIRYYNADNLRQSETITGTRDDAERELASRLGDVAKGLPVSSKPNTVLFGELADDVLTDYEVNDYSSYAHAELRYRLHMIPVFGRKKACQITTAQIKKYIVRRQNEGAAIGTVNRELQLMRHTFNLAIEGRKLLVKPHVPMLRETNVRSGFFTRVEVDRLAKCLRQPLSSMVLFGFLTGWRLGEIRRLMWRNVDFVAGEIRIDVGRDKNRAGRVFPMTPELRALLTARLTAQRVAIRKMKSKITSAVGATLGIVFSVNGFEAVGEFRKSWLTACHRAGLPCLYSKDTKKPIKALRTFHDLRRSFAREMDCRGMRRGAIKMLAGWKTDSVFERYNIVSEADLRVEVERVDAHKATSNNADDGMATRNSRSRRPRKQ